jgi:hypothetical protein
MVQKLINILALFLYKSFSKLNVGFPISNCGPRLQGFVALFLLYQGSFPFLFSLQSIPPFFVLPSFLIVAGLLWSSRVFLYSDHIYNLLFQESLKSESSELGASLMTTVKSALGYATGISTVTLITRSIFGDQGPKSSSRGIL